MNTEPAPPAPDDEEERNERESLPAAVTAWAKAVAFGLRDTWNDVLSEGRAGARQSQASRWQRFETKTKSRRKRKK